MAGRKRSRILPRGVAAARQIRLADQDPDRIRDRLDPSVVVHPHPAVPVAVSL